MINNLPCELKYGKRIKELRKANKMTHKELAEKIGIAPRTLQMWESGKIFLLFLKCQNWPIFSAYQSLTFLTFMGPKEWIKLKSRKDSKKSKLFFQIHKKLNSW